MTKILVVSEALGEPNHKRGIFHFTRELIRSLARHLAEEGPEASRLRSAVKQSMAGEPPERGGVLAALRRSPLVGAGLDLSRTDEQGRETDI